MKWKYVITDDKRDIQEHGFTTPERAEQAGRQMASDLRAAGMPFSFLDAFDEDEPGDDLAEVVSEFVNKNATFRQLKSAMREYKARRAHESLQQILARRL